jgi:hypothetical protein
MNTRSNHSEQQQAEHEVQKAAAAMTEMALQLIINPQSTAAVDRLSGLFDDVKLAADRLSKVRDEEDEGGNERQPLDPEEAALDAKTGYSEEVQ